MEKKITFCNLLHFSLSKKKRIFAVRNETCNEHISLGYHADDDTLGDSRSVCREVFVHGKNFAGAADRKRLLSRRRRLYDREIDAAVGLYADDDCQLGFAGDADAVRGDSARAICFLFFNFQFSIFNL
jgi:hypothetical protein